MVEASPTPNPSGQATLRQWRRIALERQLPQARFPSGIGVPSLIMLGCLVAIGLATCVYFMRPSPRTVPHAVIDSQQDLVAEIAHRMSVGVRRDNEDIVKVAAAYDADPTHNATSLVTASAAGQPGWRSVAIWNPSGVTLATVGEPLPPSVFQSSTSGDAIVGTLGPDQRGRVVHVVKLADGSMLGVSLVVGVRSLRLEPAASQTVMFVLNGGTLIYSQGHPLAPTDPVQALVVKAAAASKTHTSLGRLVTINGHPRVPVISASPIDGTGFSVASIVYVQRTGAQASSDAAALGIVLVLFALGGFIWTRRAFVVPVQRLIADAKAVACGERGGGSRVSRVREVHRIGTSLRLLSRQTPRDKVRAARAAMRRLTPGEWRQRSQLGATAIISVATIGAIVWSLALFAVVRDAATIPSQIVADYQNHADNAANTLRDTFDRGLETLQDLATDNAATAGNSAAAGRMLSSFAREHQRFRSVYLVGRDGRATQHAGRTSMRRGMWAGTTAGLFLDPRITTIPLVLAHVPYGTGQLVGEFDVIELRSLLDRVDGDVHVVDRRMRSMLDSGGFIPFRPVGDNDIRAAAAGALAPLATSPSQRSSRRVVAASVVGSDAGSVGTPTPSGGLSLAAASPPTAGAVSPASVLGWAVVVSRDAKDLALPTTQALHVAWLLIMLAATVAAVGWAWQYMIFVRPLRALATGAEQMTRGSQKTPITPERFDEIGALAICLEVCRQTRAEGADRLAGAARLRGVGDDYTVVMPQVRT